MSNTTDVRKRKLHSVKRLYKGEGDDSHCATCKEKTKLARDYTLVDLVNRCMYLLTELCGYNRFISYGFWNLSRLRLLAYIDLNEKEAKITREWCEKTLNLVERLVIQYANKSNINRMDVWLAKWKAAELEMIKLPPKSTLIAFQKNRDLNDFMIYNILNRGNTNTKKKGSLFSSSTKKNV